MARFEQGANRNRCFRERLRQWYLEEGLEAEGQGRRLTQLGGGLYSKEEAQTRESLST